MLVPIPELHPLPLPLLPPHVTLEDECLLAPPRSSGILCDVSLTPLKFLRPHPLRPHSLSPVIRGAAPTFPSPSLPPCRPSEALRRSPDRRSLPLVSQNMFSTRISFCVVATSPTEQNSYPMQLSRPPDTSACTRKCRPLRIATKMSTSRRHISRPPQAPSKVWQHPLLPTWCRKRHDGRAAPLVLMICAC